MNRILYFVNTWRWWYPVLWIAALVGSPFVTYFALHSSLFPAVRFVSSQEIINPDVTTDYIRVYFTFTRSRICVTDQTRWLWRWVEHDGIQVKEVVSIDSTSVPFAEVNPKQIAHLIVDYQIPKTIDDGDWFFFAKSIDQCGFIASLFGPDISQSPNIPIKIRRHIQP